MNAKQLAGEKAVEFVEDGMTVGLGTGSTVYWMVERLGARVRGEGLRVRCVPTSRRTEEQARSHGIPLVTFEEVGQLDLTIDGADEIGPGLALVKGGGGALVREKLVASASRRFVVIADASKRVPLLGRFPLPVEVIPFAWQVTARRVAAAAACRPALRPAEGGGPFVSDNGNYILDCKFPSIDDPAALDTTILAIPGVVGTGLFVRMAERVLVQEGDAVRVMTMK